MRYHPPRHRVAGALSRDHYLEGIVLVTSSALTAHAQDEWGAEPGCGLTAARAIHGGIDWMYMRVSSFVCLSSAHAAHAHGMPHVAHVSSV